MCSTLRCTLAVSIHDLAKATNERTAVQETACDAKEVGAAVERAALELGEEISPMRAQRPGATANAEAPTASWMLRIQTAPPGASVSIDGRPALGRTPLEVSGTTAGTLVVRVAKDGFASAYRDVSVTPGSPPMRVDAEFPLILLTPQRLTALLARAPEMAKRL
ncbi:MAG: PEGA domain-containing protein [Deltaproteobacteria bacterium]|nr:PEGA domain-containing protein [Deltaproteobacteria bacterium]